MVARSKLKIALAIEKGVDFKKLQIKKKEKEKAARRRKFSSSNSNGSPARSDKTQTTSNIDAKDEETDPVCSGKKEISCMNTNNYQVKSPETSQSDCESSIKNEVEHSEEEDNEIAVSDLGDEYQEENDDLVPHHRLMINNTVALATCLKRISLGLTELPFSEHQSVTMSTPVSVHDISDDINRELAFYAQSLTAAQKGRKLLQAEGVPFTRPNDYFAEMVKSDEHMTKIKSKMMDEAATKKASAEARKQRDLKKFGKQVQVAKLQERDKERKRTLEKIKVLKRSKLNTNVENETEADLFDVAIDEEIKSTQFSKDKRARDTRRQKKDERFGFGGKKKFTKSGDAISSGDLRNFSTKKMKKVIPKRPGKARRASIR